MGVTWLLLVTRCCGRAKGRPVGDHRSCGGREGGRGESEAAACGKRRKASVRVCVFADTEPPGSTARGAQTITAALPGWFWSQRAQRTACAVGVGAGWQQHRTMPPGCRRRHIAHCRTGAAVGFAAEAVPHRATPTVPSSINAPHTPASRRENSRQGDFLARRVKASSVRSNLPACQSAVAGARPVPGGSGPSTFRQSTRCQSDHLNEPDPCAGKQSI